MKHIFAVWQQVGAELGQGGRVLLLADYDGTLAPIVDRPEAAALPKATWSLLRKLAQSGRYIVGIISGRGLMDLKSRVGLEGVVYVGNHGLEIESPDIHFVHPVALECRPLLTMLYGILQQKVGTVVGTLVENKVLSVSVHYRLVDPVQVPKVKSVVEQVVRMRGLGRVRTVEGKQVCEVRPAVNWHKGEAIRLILAGYRQTPTTASPLAVFLGDDTTDEDGFEVVRELKGIAVLVSEKPRPSAARYYLRSPAEVREFLARVMSLNSDRRSDGLSPVSPGRW